MKKRYTLILLLLVFMYHLSSGQTFTTVSGDPLTNLNTTSFGQAWGDFNNDGWIDVYVANGGNNNLLFENNKSGGFVAGVIMPTSIFGSLSYGGSWADYDNDGDIDLYGAEFTGTNRLYINDGGGSFSFPTYFPIVEYKTSVSTSWVDFNNDRQMDLSVANFGASMSNNLYSNNGSNSFTDIYPGTGGPDQSLAWSDFNNDGFMDLYVARSNSNSNLLFTNDGTSISLATGSTTMTDATSSYSASWGDYDNDGDFDLFVTNVGSSSVNLLFRNEGDGTFTKITSLNVVTDIGDSRGSDWGDFNNDGWLDLFVANRNQDFLYQNNGDGTFTRITTGDIVNLVNNSYSCSWNDVNNDGFLDLYITTEAATNANALFINNTNSNNYLNAHLVGTASNVSAIGAKIRVKATIAGNPMWQVREIRGQNGHGSQGSLNAEFGLGDAPIIDSIEVRWPSGNVQLLTNQSVNQFMTITEGTPPDPPSSLTIISQTYNSVLLKWVDNATNEDNFIIEVSTPDNLNFSEVGTSIMNGVSFQVNGLTPSTTYYFRVRAANASGMSAYSNEVTTVTDADPLAAPDNLVATAVSQSAIDLQWNDNSSTETDFIILRSTSSGSGYGIIGSVGANQTTYNDTGLNPGTNYYYVVRASDGTFESGDSNEGNATTFAALADPDNLVATVASFSEINLTWNDNSGTETGFVVERSIPSIDPYQIIATLGADVTSYNDTGLNPETEYRYRVMATGSSGDSNYSNEATTTTPPAILAPDNLSATTASHDQIDLTWQDNATNETGYEIERSETPGTGFVLLFTTTADATNYTDNDVAINPNTTYYYRIRAVNATYQSSYSNEANATTTTYTPVTFTMGDHYVQPANEVVVPIEVQNFTNVLTTQLKITWDETVLSFNATEQYNLPTLSGKISNPAPGTLIVAWDDEDLTGESLSDGSTMFAIRFNAIGGEGTFSNLTFTEEPGYPEVADVSSIILDYDINNGRVDVLSLVTLSGRLLTPWNEPVANADVFFDLAMTEISSTDANGNYSYDVMPGSEVYVQPAKSLNNVNTNGITTLDIAMIRRHIFTTNLFNNPYKTIAADVNSSGSVSALDIPAIRSVILGLQNDFDKLLWKFVPQSSTFTDPNNPFPYDTLIHIPSASNTNDLDFIALKLGDVNDTWDSSIGRQTEAKPMIIKINEAKNIDNKINVTLSAIDFNQVIGYQFTVKFDPAKLTFTGLKSNPFNIHYSAHEANNGYITFAWDNPSGEALLIEDGTALMNLQFELVSPNNIAEISIGSDITPALGYNHNFNERIIQQWENQVVTDLEDPLEDIIDVQQNYPNPFSSETTITFNLPKTADASITIFNLLGVPLDEIKGTYAAGRHEVIWKNEQKIKGILFYQFRSGDYKTTKRMVAQ